jgi:hypothetical protein
MKNLYEANKLTTALVQRVRESFTGISEPSTDVSEPFTDVSESSTDVSESSTEVSKPFTEVSESSTEVSEPFTEVSESSTEVSKPFTDVSESFTGVSRRRIGGNKQYVFATVIIIWHFNAPFRQTANRYTANRLITFFISYFCFDCKSFITIFHV